MRINKAHSKTLKISQNECDTSRNTVNPLHTYFIFPNKFVTCRLTLLKNSSWTWRKLKFIPYRHPELTNSRAFSLYRDVLCSISLELDPDLSLISNLHLKYGHFLFAPSLTVPSSLCAATAKTFTSDSPYPDSKLLAEAVVDSSPDLLSPLHPHRHARIGHPPPVPLWPPFCGLPPKLFRIGVLQTTTSSLNCPNLQSTGCCAPTITPQSLQGLQIGPSIGPFPSPRSASALLAWQPANLPERSHLSTLHSYPASTELFQVVDTFLHVTRPCHLPY